MHPSIKQFIALLVLVVMATVLVLLFPSEHSVRWKTYENTKFGFSMNVPVEVLADSNDESSWVPLNIFEDNDAVYFTTHSLAETLENKSWQFRVGGAEVRSEEEIGSFLDSIYEVKGCQVELVDDAGNYFVRTVNSDLLTGVCSIGGKVRTWYDKGTGKVVTYNLLEHFFFVPNGALDEEALASFVFAP